MGKTMSMFKTNICFSAVQNHIAKQVEVKF